MRATARVPGVSRLGRGRPRTSTTGPTRKTRRVVLHVHLSQAAIDGSDHVGRVENTRTPVTADQIREWCGHPDTRLTVKPVMDLDGSRQRRRLRDPRPDRRSRRAPRPLLRLSLVHPTGPHPAARRTLRRLRPRHPMAPGPDLHLLRLAPLCRTHHRLKTHCGWTLHHPRPRHLPLVVPPRLPVPPRPPRHPRRQPRSTTHAPPSSRLTPPHTPQILRGPRHASRRQPHAGSPGTTKPPSRWLGGFVLVVLRSDRVSIRGSRLRMLSRAATRPGALSQPSQAQAGRAHFVILVTRPAPTVRPPSRIAKRSPSSMAIGWISSTVISVLSPGMTISLPSGRVTTPVTSVVRK